MVARERTAHLFVRGGRHALLRGDTMYRGTTPTLEFTLPFAVSELSKAWITIGQFGKSVIKRTLAECTVDGDKIIVTLTQQETLQLRVDDDTEIQIRALKPSGEALASEIITVDVKRILEEGVIE